MVRSHARDGNEYQTPGHCWLPAKRWDAWFLNSRNPKLVWNSWNLACYHGAASTCHGKKIVPFGAGSGVSFSQTRASHNKPDGYGRERVTFGDETISVVSYCFQKISSVNIEQHESVLSWNFGGSFGLFYTLTRFSRHFMCIIQIWTTSTCSNALKLVEKSNLCPWVNF